MPPVGDSSGEGTYDPVRAPGIPPTVSEPEPEEGVDAIVETACSEIAVVGMAFAAAPDVTPKGILPRDEEEPRDARDPGRSGDGRAGMWLF